MMDYGVLRCAERGAVVDSVLGCGVYSLGQLGYGQVSRLFDDESVLLHVGYVMGVADHARRYVRDEDERARIGGEMVRDFERRVEPVKRTLVFDAYRVSLRDDGWYECFDRLVPNVLRIDGGTWLELSRLGQMHLVDAVVDSVDYVVSKYGLV